MSRTFYSCNLYNFVFTKFLILLFLFLNGFTGASENNRDSIKVETKFGAVVGEIFVLENGVKVDGFRGIPYAQPPTGELMFQKPVPPKLWEGQKETKQWPNRCLQFWVLGEVLPKFSSDSLDCLYLNLFAPHSLVDSFPDGYPVMVWIHGGAYNFGSSVEYGFKGIIERIVPRNVLFITIHYRLGPYGFFATEDGEAPNNLGLWDQTLALKWINENVARFKGDPNRVTVFGESSGASSTSMLTLSPHSNYLFHQAILMSGTHLAPWAQNRGPVKYSRMLAKNLSCDWIFAKELLDCLRNKTQFEIFDAYNAVAEAAKYEAMILFNPVVDGDFFPESFQELLKKAPTKPTVAGTTLDEMGLLTTPSNTDVQTVWAVCDSNYTFEEFRNFVAVVFPDGLYKNGPVLRKLALRHYLGKRSLRTNSSFLVDQYTKLFGDFFLFYPQYLDAQQRFRTGSSVWLYSFDFFSSALFPVDHKHKGAYHFMELPYLFDAALLQPKHHYDESEKQMLDIMTSLWTNFAIFGDPTPDSVEGIRWEKISAAFSAKYLSIKPQLEMKLVYHPNCLAFWDQLIPQIESLNFSYN